MVLVQKGSFFRLFFLGNIGQKNLFHNTLERKNVFLAYKKRLLNSRKIEIFTKGLVHRFGQKGAFFTSFLLRQYTPGKCVL